ncbi:MAG: VanZ family protein, partial [Gammaproteobacteria bacterium]|nr:VanZ family protein [Gammaproteobacteria bacterium]
LRFWRITGWTVVAAAWYVALDPSPVDLSGIEFGDKLVHTSAYLGMMLWLSQCYARKYRSILAVFFVAMGIAIEYLQGWSGYRTFEVADMFANTGGVIIGWLISYSIAGKLFFNLERLISR